MVMQWIFNDGFSLATYTFFLSLFLPAFHKFGLGHPNGRALIISAEAGLEMTYLNIWCICIIGSLLGFLI
jgi:hypothetical protein